ncbi:MAG: hemerythrin-like domain-containing protein [Pseudohongiellaceae bacterium]|jgi:hemerythrin-like domain-containing protein
MNAIMQQLNDDHRHMAKVLNYLNFRLRKAHDIEYAAPELWMLLTVLDYIQVYPERWYHPVEDLIFTRLAQYYPECSLHVEVSEEEYERLESMTQAMLELGNGFLEDKEQAIKSMRLIMLCYLNMQEKHMKRENEHLYPLIEQHFGKDDWKAIAQAMPMIDDPLFGEAIKNNYEKVYQEIIAVEQVG